MYPSTNSKTKQMPSRRHAVVAQMAEQRAFTPRRVGSTPTGRTMNPFSKNIPHVVVVRPAVQVGRQQAFSDAGVAQWQSGGFTSRDSRGSSPFARTSTMNTKTANVHLELLQLTSAGTAVCVLA